MTSIGTGFNKIEGIVVFITFGALFLIGMYAVGYYSWLVAIGSFVLLLFLWFYMHRIRICNFCTQSCPYRRKSNNPNLKRMGFSKQEMILFYPAVLLILTVYMLAIFKFSVIIGLVVSGFVVYALVLYRIKICPNYHIPCPFNPNKVGK